MAPSFVGFDLDGTVFTRVTRTTLSPRVRAALQRAHDEGAAVIAISGRPWLQLGRDLMELDGLDWVVGCNGACIADAQAGGRVVAARTVSWDVVDELVERYHVPETGWNAFLEHDSYYEVAHRSYLVDGHELRGPLGEGVKVNMENECGVVEHCWFVDSVVPYLNAARDSGGRAPYKLIITSPDAGLLSSIEGELLARGDLAVADMPGSLEITAVGVDKGDATLELLERLGLDPAMGVSFGDGGNDITMTRRPWRFVAMGNAEPQIKAVADDLTDSVEEDGVATWLERHLDDDLIPLTRPEPVGERRSL